MQTPNVRVGVGVFVLKDGEFIMLQRDGAHGVGTWSVPGGHLEFGESFEDTAAREVEEETGLKIKNIRFGGITNDHFVEENKHYVTIWMLSDWADCEPENREPEKCTGLAWHDFSDLPSPLFLPWKQLLSSDFFAAIKDEISRET